jgi:hypothetical protein
MPTRAALPGTEDRPAESYIRDNIDDRQREVYADQVARSKTEGPEAGLAGFNIQMPGRVMDPSYRKPNVPVTGAESVHPGQARYE